MHRPIREVMERLERVSLHEGIPFGRAHSIFDAENAHAAGVLALEGYLALSDAFKCFFIETVELINTQLRPKVKRPVSEHYVIFLPRLTSDFRALCGAERVAINGYPYQGYTLIRNVFDSLVLSSAALQSVVDFYSIEGVEPGATFDPKASHRLRKKAEFEARKKMTGKDSGLSDETVAELEKWDGLFDAETHGSRLSKTHAMEWMKGVGPLQVLPLYDEDMFAVFLNRYCEVGWMLHRLVPLAQPHNTLLDQNWADKWHVIDESFEQMVDSLTHQLGKRIGRVIVEFVKSKFPFSPSSAFPW
jgi:hypothetical protein